MQSAGSKMECPHFARFVRDLAQYYTLLLLHPRLAPCVRTKLLDAAQVLHRLTSVTVLNCLQTIVENVVFII